MRPMFSALAGLLLLAAPAWASDGKQAAVSATQAARALQQHAADTAAAGARIDYTRAPAADYFQRVFDLKAFAELTAVSAADMPWLLDWFGAVRMTNSTLLYFGADPRRPAELTPEKMEQNLSQYEDQFAAATAFSLRMFPRVMKTAQAFFDSLSDEDRKSPVRQDGFLKMRQGYVESVEGSLIFLAAGGSKPANVRMITATLRETASAWAALVARADRPRLAHLIATARDKAGDEQAADNLRAVQLALGTNQDRSL